VVDHVLPAAWSGDAYRHIPGGSPIDILDFRLAGRVGNNRWNVAGEPTLYLASDLGVTIAEFARHYQERRSPAVGREGVIRQIYRLRVEIERALDLRDPAVLASLAIRDAPHCFLDAPLARATAHELCSATLVQAILVPSMAFLDAPDRWIAVLFLEELPPDPRQFITRVQQVRTFRIDV
jgi:RES domain-containing protein